MNYWYSGLIPRQLNQNLGGGVICKAPQMIAIHEKVGASSPELV